MVNVQFGASTKDMWVVEDVYPEAEAERIVNSQKAKIFGVVSGLMKAFSKQKGTINITAKEKRYEPFWHVEGKSTFEYKRSTGYSFPVKPEVIGVKISGKEYKTEQGQTTIQFMGEDHCFEQYEKKLIQSAVTDETKGLEFYITAKKRSIKDMKDLTRTGTVVPMKLRASFLVSTIVKDVLRPIHADTIIDEKVEITQLDLYFRPVWTFELYETDTKRTKIVEVDGVTGNLTKVNTWTRGLKELMGKDGSWFDLGTDIGADLVGNIIPGVGAAMAGGKFLKDRHTKKKDASRANKTQAAYAKTKGKRR